MKILDRYIANNIIAATLIIVMILFGVQMFVELISELQDVGKGGYGVFQALIYVPLQLPNDIYSFFPVAGLIGGLLGLGRLANYSELIVMRAAGVSKFRITLSVLKVTIIMLVVATFIGEVVAPAARNFAENYKTQAEVGKQNIPLRQGIWVRDGDNFIHINQVLPHNEIAGIIRYEFAQQKLLVASYAEKAVLQNNQWVFNNVNETTFHDKTVTSQHIDQQVWGVSFDPYLINLDTVDPTRISLVTLVRYIHYLHGNGLLATRYEFEFWQRVLQPFATLVMIALAIPFIFGPLRTVTTGSRILVGIIIGFAFYTFNEFLGPFSMVYQIPPLWSAASPIILFAVIDGILLWLTR